MSNVTNLRLQFYPVIVRIIQESVVGHRAFLIGNDEAPEIYYERVRNWFELEDDSGWMKSSYGYTEAKERLEGLKKKTVADGNEISEEGFFITVRPGHSVGRISIAKL